MKHGPWEELFRGGTGCLGEPVDLSLPNLLTDLDEAGFSGVVRNKTQVKRAYPSAEGNREIVSRTCWEMTRYSLFSVLYPWLGLLAVGCERGLANSLLDGWELDQMKCSWARWLTLPHSFTITQLAFFSPSKVFFHILSVIFFPFQQRRLPLSWFHPETGREFNNAAWQGIKGPFSQGEQEKVIMVWGTGKQICPM